MKFLTAIGIGMAHAFPLGGAISGAVVGVNWLNIEYGGMAGVANLEPPGEVPPLPPPPVATTPQSDFPPNAGQFGMVIHPKGVEPPVPPSDPNNKVLWKSSDLTITQRIRTVDGRRYPIIVDRANADPNVRQIWWPSDDRKSGYLGRWGTRVTRDTKTRRAGMVFPDFWKMFFERLVKRLSQP